MSHLVPLLEFNHDTLNKKYNEAINNHDAAALAALYTEDAIFVTNTGPVYGRKAIGKWYEDGFKGSQPKNNIRALNSPTLRPVPSGNGC